MYNNNDFYFQNPAIKVEMSDHLKSMNIYAVEDGDTIYVNH